MFLFSSRDRRNGDFANSIRPFVIHPALRPAGDALTMPLGKAMNGLTLTA
jgi:hypothetical protein